MSYIPISERENRVCPCGILLKKQQSKYCSRKCKDRAYRLANYDKVRAREDAHNLVRKNRMKGVISDLTEMEWLEILAAYNYSCAYCGSNEGTLHREHVIPVSRGGGYTKSNIVPACAKCNHSKGTKTPAEWKFPLAQFEIITGEVRRTYMRRKHQWK